MSHPTNLATPLTLTLTNGDWDVIRGLLAIEANRHKEPCRYFELGLLSCCKTAHGCGKFNHSATCERIMCEIDSAKGTSAKP